MQKLPKSILDRAVERFLTYVRIWTSSDMHSDASPSTDRQLVLSRLLKDELESFGPREIVERDGNLVAKFSASDPSLEQIPPLLFCAHMDTAGDFSGKDVNPLHVHAYDGNSIHLKNDITIDPKDNPELEQYIDTHIITSDGTTLLGADDKAGIAGICTVLQILQEKKLEHGPLEIVFNTDEEIGRGIEGIPLDHLEARCGVTADGQEMGSYEYENFNAVTGKFRIEGTAVHPGSAKNKMVNAIQICTKLISLLAENEFPESTDARDGYVCPVDIDGSMAEVTLALLVRDFSQEGMEQRLQKLERIAQAITLSCSGATVVFSYEWSYKNMYETVRKYPVLLEITQEAIQDAGVSPIKQLIRGGTDGAHFAQQGIALVNLFTGAHNLHGPREWLAVAAFEKSIASMVNLTSLWIKKHGTS